MEVTPDAASDRPKRRTPRRPVAQQEAEMEDDGGGSGGATNRRSPRARKTTTRVIDVDSPTAAVAKMLPTAAAAAANSSRHPKRTNSSRTPVSSSSVSSDDTETEGDDDNDKEGDTKPAAAVAVAAVVVAPPPAKLPPTTATTPANRPKRKRTPPSTLLAESSAAAAEAKAAAAATRGKKKKKADDSDSKPLSVAKLPPAPITPPVAAAVVVATAASFRPKRKRTLVASYSDEVEAVGTINNSSSRGRGGRKGKLLEEEDSKPVAKQRSLVPPYPIGLVIQKKFGNEYYQGRVIFGPKEGQVEPLWHVRYDDGDQEEMNWHELMECKLEGQQQRRLLLENDDDDEQIAADNDEGDDSYQNQVKDYDKALKDLCYRMGNTEEEVRAALDQMTSPYGLNEAMQLIHEAKQDPDSYVPREKFVVKKGMKVRKNFLGSTYYGEVMNDKAQVRDVPGIFGETKKVKCWQVKFEDSDVEDMDFNELLAHHAGRPTRQHPTNGRQLCALELFCGCAIVTQEFAERKWRVRSIDNHKNSHATDVVDIMKVRYKHIGMVPDFIWASPPCTTYTLVTGGRHRSKERGQQEKTPEARKHNRYLVQMFAIMKWAKSMNPHLIVVIENPVGQLQNMPLMKKIEKELNLKKVTVDYCSFGRDDKKPTHLWTNDWKLRKTLSDYRCDEKCPYNGGVHPIGVKQNSKQYNAAAIPDALAEEVADEVCARFQDLRIRKETDEIVLSEEEIKEFDKVLASGGGGSNEDG